MFCTHFHALTKWSQMHPNTTNCTKTLVSGPMGWVWCVHCKKIQTWHRCIKSRCDFVSRTFVLTAPVRYVLHQVSCSYETIRNALKYCETDRNISLASNIGCVRCEKSRYDFAAPTFALIAPVHPVLHRVSCCYKTIPNALKHYEMH